MIIGKKVEKIMQKQIVIGKDGNTIKKIGNKVTHPKKAAKKSKKGLKKVLYTLALFDIKIKILKKHRP